MFIDTLRQHSWEETTASIMSKTAKDVEIALSKDNCSLEDFKALISPAGSNFIEQIAQKSRQKTLRRFGKTIQMYVPLYLSNFCENQCVYCGFNAKNSIPRKILTLDEIESECKAIKKMGFEHLLLVTGEASRKAGIDYLIDSFRIARKYFSLISIEIQPLQIEEYALLVKEGLHSVYIYQETYNEQQYPAYHPKGKKTDFEFRVHTPDRLGLSGVHKIGLGILGGLEDWRTDSFMCALHLKYLEKNYWKTKYSISFPRLRPHMGGFEPNSIMSERDLLQLMCAYRLMNEEVELSLSTRESATFRDNAMKLGITSMSAGSKTEPGGYANASDKPSELEQFSIHDNRSPVQMMEAIKSQGYEAVWKDWDSVLQ